MGEERATFAIARIMSFVRIAPEEWVAPQG